MKTKSLITSTVTLFAAVILLVVPVANAQQNEPIVVPEVQVEGIEPSSGFVDEDGNPISQEDYAKIREHNSKNIFQREPLVSALVVGGAFVVAAILIARKKKK